MKKTIAIAIIFLLTTVSAIAGNIEEKPYKPKSDQDSKAAVLLRGTVVSLNELLSKDSQKIRLFAQLADKDNSLKMGYQVPSNKVVKVMNSDSWPEDTVTSYIVLIRENGTVSAFQEVPVSESGDWFNSYTHYYDENGQMIAFQRTSSFFNGCPDSPSNETSTYYYQKHRLVAKDYSLNGENNRPLDSRKCEFMYRLSYVIRKTWVESKNASGIGQVW